MSASRFAKIQFVLVLLLVAALFVSLVLNVAATLTRETASEVLTVAVKLSGAHTTESWDEREADRPQFELPLLVLHRQRSPATEVDRTLEISISGLPGGAEVQVEALSFHVDVSSGTRHAETVTFGLPDHLCTQENPCVLPWTLDPATMTSDFYFLHVKDGEGNLLWENPYPERPDFVVLDTWDVALGRGSAERDADYSARVYYATMFPFARGQDDVDHRLSPDEVIDFIDHQFVPIIVESWQTQVVAWGFGDPLHPDWDADGVVDIIITDRPFALFGGTGTYSRAITSDGRTLPDRRIWWLSSLANFSFYDSLENAYKATYAHEFFHLMQWNVRLGTGRPANYWLNVFLEAQAAAAASIQYPEIELGKVRAISQGNEYARAANRFLAERLNTSYRDLDASETNRYDAALYWRFLFEQYGSTAVFRVATEEMARIDDADIVHMMDGVLDATFARFDGPFRSFEDSLAAFARANYALRLENGRCGVQNVGACGGTHYDPDAVYIDPPLEKMLDFDGDRLVFDGAIPASYGMDFLEVRLDPGLRGRPLRLEFQGEGEISRFSVQVWQIGPGAMKPRAVVAQPEIVARTAGGAHVYSIPQVDTAIFDRLGLIITRLDPNETTDPEGAYGITLDSTS